MSIRTPSAVFLSGLMLSLLTGCIIDTSPAPDGESVAYETLTFPCATTDEGLPPALTTSVSDIQFEFDERQCTSDDVQNALGSAYDALGADEAIGVFGFYSCRDAPDISLRDVLYDAEEQTLTFWVIDPAIETDDCSFLDGFGEYFMFAVKTSGVPVEGTSVGLVGHPD